MLKEDYDGSENEEVDSVMLTLHEREVEKTRREIEQLKEDIEIGKRTDDYMRQLKDTQRLYSCKTDVATFIANWIKDGVKRKRNEQEIISIKEYLDTKLSNSNLCGVCFHDDGRHLDPMCGKRCCGVKRCGTCFHVHGAEGCCDHTDSFVKYVFKELGGVRK